MVQLLNAFKFVMVRGTYIKLLKMSLSLLRGRSLLISFGVMSHCCSCVVCQVVPTMWQVDIFGIKVYNIRKLHFWVIVEERFSVYRNTWCCDFPLHDIWTLQCLPMQTIPSPVYPALQMHTLLPGVVLLHSALAEQPPLLVLQASIAEQWQQSRLNSCA